MLYIRTSGTHGFKIWPRNSIRDQERKRIDLHMMISKQLLGVHKSTTNIGVLLELGRLPLSTYAIKIAVKNWERIKKNIGNRILLASYRDAIIENLPWMEGIKNNLQKNGMLNMYTNSEEQNLNINNKIFQVLSDQFHQNSFEAINYETSKLRTYATFKKEIGMEKYLTIIKNPEVRKSVTKLRLSNHNLRIETGRHHNLPKHQRTCPICLTAIETEEHFLFHCPAYEPIRNTFIRNFQLRNQQFTYCNPNDRLAYVMSHLSIEVANYIFRCSQIRSFLIARYKRAT